MNTAALKAKALQELGNLKQEMFGRKQMENMKMPIKPEQMAEMSNPLSAGLALGGEALKGAKGGNAGDIRSQVRNSFGPFTGGSINNGFSFNKAIPFVAVAVVAVAYFKFVKHK